MDGLSGDKGAWASSSWRCAWLGCCLWCLAFPWSASAAGDQSGGYEGPREKFHIYLLIGNAMLEPSTNAPADSPVLERCYLLNPQGKWEPAKAPLNRYSTVKAAGDTRDFAPGYGFVKAMLEKDKEASIGLIVSAATSSRVEDWHVKSELFRAARSRGKVALRQGILKGVVWHHGLDSSKVFRLEELKDMVSSLRTDLGVLDLPVIVGEIPGDRAMNSLYAAFAGRIHAAGIAGADGLRTTAAGCLDAASAQVLGARYAEQMLAVQARVAEQDRLHVPWTEPVIDTHVHSMGNTEHGLDVVSRWMEKNNISRVVDHALTGSRPKDARQREIMLANYRKYQGRIFRFCFIEPDEVKSVEEAVAVLEKEKADGAIGFGEHYGVGLMFDDPKNMRLFAACEKVGLPVMFHIDQNKNMDEANFPHLRHALESYPKCKFIAHAGWWAQLSLGVCDRMLQDYPNLYADPSGMVDMLNLDRAYTREVLIRNADKIMFGNDDGWWSIKDEKQAPALRTLIDQLGLPKAVLSKFYRENAEKFFGFSGGGKPAE